MSARWTTVLCAEIPSLARAEASSLVPLVTSTSGRVINTSDDGIIAAFDNASEAVECALALRAIVPRARIGIDSALSTTEGPDRIINCAGDLLEQAKPGEIRLSE